MPNETKEEERIIQHKLYDYTVSAFELIHPDLPEVVPLPSGCIENFYILKDYENAYFPIFRISFTLNPRLYEFIVFNKIDIKFRIRLQCNTKNFDGEEEFTEDIFNDMFVPIIEDNQPFYDDSIYTQTVEQLKTNPEKLTGIDLAEDNFNADSKKHVEFYLYKISDLINSKNVVNAIYSSGNMINVLVSLLSENGFNKIMMSPCDNEGSFNQVIIPVMNLINVFNYLEKNYGLYASGTLKFFDYRCTYILNKSGHPNCYEPDEYKKTIFSIHETKYGESRMSGTGSEDKNKEYHIFPDPSRVTTKNLSMLNDHIDGNNMLMINAGDSSVNTAGGTGQQIGGGVTRVTQNNNSNSYLAKQYINTVADNNSVLSLVLTDAYEKALTPNKEFIFNFNDTRLKSGFSGYYRVKETNHYFKKNGPTFALTTIMTFAKKEDITQAEKDAIDKIVIPDKPVKKPNEEK